MLVLTRKPGEKIIVGNLYEIEIAAVTRGVVKFIVSVDQPLILMPGNIELEVGGDGGPREITFTRKVDDSVLIGMDPQSQVEVLVVSVKGEAVRVGVKAPREVTVHREEVWRMIQAENIAAAQAAELDPTQLKELLSRRSEAGPSLGPPEGATAEDEDAPPD